MIAEFLLKWWRKAIWSGYWAEASVWFSLARTWNNQSLLAILVKCIFKIALPLPLKSRMFRQGECIYCWGKAETSPPGPAHLPAPVKALPLGSRWIWVMEAQPPFCPWGLSGSKLPQAPGTFPSQVLPRVNKGTLNYCLWLKCGVLLDPKQCKCRNYL